MDIEEKASLEITVEVNASKPHLSYKISRRQAKTITPAADHFPDSSVLHELLHILRLLVEGVPQLPHDE